VLTIEGIEMYKNKSELEETPEPSVLVEKRLSFLIRRYLSHPTNKLAQSVVTQLEELLVHPDCIGFPNHRCAYKKMLQQWRALA
jgi:hypothetical protein